MAVKLLRAHLAKMQDALASAMKYSEEDLQQANTAKRFYDFKTNKASYHKGTIDATFNNIKKSIWQLAANPGVNESALVDLLGQVKELERRKQDYSGSLGLVQNMLTNAQRLKHVRLVHSGINIRPPVVPEVIRDELYADIKEVENCFNAGCYRSAVVLCARILETALHRKYYEVTGKDILETNPGIGLGTLVAKLTDKGLKFDPGVSQQIHLINQVRVYSVHKKQTVFLPTPQQAHATLLFTLDVVGKLLR
tara:strand:- start:50 stop:805 length:756 start_codon:yes stop_codon:yes gene_type:complete